MAISTYKTFLVYDEEGDGDEYEILVDIKSFPALGGAPEMLDATGLSNKMRVYIAGVQATEALEFTANYTQTDFDKVNALDDGTAKSLGVFFGGDLDGDEWADMGDDGMFKFEGAVSVHVDGGEVNAVQDMIITVAPSTEISFSVPEDEGE